MKSALWYIHHLRCYPLQNLKGKGSASILATLKAEKEELESLLGKERLTSVQLKQDLTEAEARNSDLYKVDITLLYVLLAALDLMITIEKLVEFGKASMLQCSCSDLS